MWITLCQEAIVNFRLACYNCLHGTNDKAQKGQEKEKAWILDSYEKSRRTESSEEKTGNRSRETRRIKILESLRSSTANES